MKIIKAYKTELNPNNVQRTKFSQHAGARRFVFNWALSLLENEYKEYKKEFDQHLEARKLLNLPEYSIKEIKEFKKELWKKYISPSAITLHKILNSKKEFEFPWMYDCSKWAMQNALYDIENAYRKFYEILRKPKKRKKGKKGLQGFPKMKKKDKKDSFTLDNPVIVGDNWIQLPKIGKIKLKESEYIPEGRYKSATVSKRAGRWFVSVQKEVEFEQGDYSHNEVIGVDLGIKTFATCSDGTIIEHNKEKAKRLNRKLKLFQRKMSKQKKGSKSKQRTKLKIQKLNFDMANLRKDTLHKATTLLAKTKSAGTVVIEDLSVSGMLKNHNLARAVAEVGMFEFRRKLDYKMKWSGKSLIVADRFFPSSKIVNSSGEVNDKLKLSDRWVVNPDGTKTDRDLNASYNLRDYGLAVLRKTSGRYTGVSAGGEESCMDVPLGIDRCSLVKPVANIKLDMQMSKFV